MNKLILILFCIFNLAITIKGQNTRDSLTLIQLNQKIGKLDNLTKNVERFIKIDYNYINKHYSILRTYEKEKSKLLLIKILDNSILSENEKHSFIINNFKYFSDDENNYIKSYLEINIQPNDYRYHELVSIYHLLSQIREIENVSDSLFTKLIIDLFRTRFDKSNINQLRDLATLINLGLSDEEIYLNEINNLYTIAKKHRKLDEFYLNILGNSVYLLNSKNAVIKTIYMLKETDVSPVAHYDDLATQSYSQQYFYLCIQPKLKHESELTVLALLDLEKNSELIINKIINDEKIWRNHININ